MLNSFTSEPVISQLWIYPIKSLGGISLEKSPLEKRGLQYDRRWMLVDGDNHFMSQRKTPKMALVEVELADYGLAVRAPDMPVLIIPYPDAEIELYEEIVVTCWDDTITAHHINTAIDNWFSEFFGQDCQLVYMPEKTLRTVDTAFVRESAKDNEIISFSDGFPNLMISEASLEDLNKRVDIEITMNRFRPNIVISGCDAYAEDTLGHFTINQIDFYAVKPCSRCIVTTINPESAKIESKEPLKTLAGYRKKNNKVMFGQNLLHKLTYSFPNELKIGDKINIIEASEGITFD